MCPKERDVPFSALLKTSTLKEAIFISQVAQTREISIKLEKVAPLSNLLSDRVMSAPGVVSNGKVVRADGVPSRKKTSHG